MGSMNHIRNGKMGDIYMAKRIVYSYRASIGHVKDSPNALLNNK